MKKNKLLGFICIILIAVIVVLLAIFVPPMLKKNGLNPGTKGSSSGTEKLDVSEEQVKKYLKDFDLYRKISCGKTILDIGYSDDFKVFVALNSVDSSLVKEEECSKLFTEDKLEFAGTPDQRYRGSSGVCYSNNTSSTAKTISYNDANKMYKKLFGGEIPKQSFNGLNIDSKFYAFFDYLNDKDLFVSMSCAGCGGACQVKYSITEYKSYTLNDNTLTIDIYHSTGELYSNDHHQSYYVNLFGEKIDCVNPEECESKIKDKFLDKLDLYQLILEYKDGNFIFKDLIKKLA